MPIIGMNYTKIEAERTGTAPKTEINTNPKVLDVKEMKIEGLGAPIDAVSVEFDYTSDFTPSIGKIAIQGAVIYQTPKAKDLLKAWKKDKSLPSDDHVEILNYLFRKVSIEALRLADLMQLPPVINLPKIVPKAKK